MHHDGYLLMWYRCKKCGVFERVWNSRDKVSPFTITCVKCEGTMSHVLWDKDLKIPDYKLEPGQRYFADFTKERAEKAADEFIGNTKSTEYGQRWSHEELQKLKEEFIHNCLTDDMYMDILTA